MKNWTCSQCGEVHTQSQMGYSFAAPWPWYTTPAKERELHGTLTENNCVLFNEDFFIRGCLEIPIIGQSEPLIWGVWMSLSQNNFERVRQQAKDPNRVDEPPYFGWFSSRVPVYPDTLLLKAKVHSREVGIAPYIELEPTNHPLAIEQRESITTDRAQEIMDQMQHKWLHPEWDKKGLWGGVI